MATAFIPPPAISREASDEIARLYNEGLISPQEYRHIVHANQKAEKEAQEFSRSPGRIPDVYDAYAHRHDPSYWAHPRLYDANGPALDSMCLVEFVRKFCVPRKGHHAGRIKYHRHGIITKKIQFHPEYSSDPTFEGGRDFGKHCRFALVRYRPWIDAPFGRKAENDNGNLTVKDNNPNDEDCIWQWQEYLLELRERMHLIPDVLLPEELKGGGAGIELLVVPFVEQQRAEEPEEETEKDVNYHLNTNDAEEVDNNVDLDDEDDEEISICLSSAMEAGADAGADAVTELRDDESCSSSGHAHDINAATTKSNQTFETAGSSSSSDGSFVQSPWEEASFGEVSFGSSISAHSSSGSAQPVRSDPSSTDPDQEGLTSSYQKETDHFVQKEGNLFAQATNSWETTFETDFPTIDGMDGTNAWETSTTAFFAAPPTSPTRRLAPSRRDLASSACRASPCRTSKRMLPAEYVFEKAEAIERTYQGDVSQAYEKLQGKIRHQRS